MSSEALPAQRPIHGCVMPRGWLQRQGHPGESAGEYRQRRGLWGERKKEEGGERKKRKRDREKGERVTHKDR